MGLLPKKNLDLSSFSVSPFTGTSLASFADLFQAVLAGLGTSVSEAVVQGLLSRYVGIDFKYTVTDSSTGRELQNLPIHNMAGLGEPTGQRPFRPFAKPILFAPRSTIRVEVEEVSAGDFYADAELCVVLHGYKILGYDGAS